MDHKKHSIIKTLNISYLILSLSTLIIVSSVLFFAWMSSNNTLISTLQHESQEQLLTDVETVLSNPIHILSFGSDLIKTDSIDINIPVSRNPYFVNTLKNAPNYIYSYSLGTNEGYYYGARRGADETLEIMLADSTTDSHSIYYSIDNTSNINAKISTNPVFDPRTRPWYNEAITKNRIVFSPIYKHFVMNDLALSASTPVYNGDNAFVGVLGVHLTLNRLNEGMSDYSSQYHGRSYIIERDSGYMVANSLGLDNFKNSSDTFERIPFKSLASQDALNALAQYKATGKINYSANHGFRRSFTRIVPYSSYGLNWLIIIELPDHPIISTYYMTIFLALVLIFCLAGISSYIWTKRNKKVLLPIIELTNITQAYSEGNNQLRVNSYQDNEIGRLAEGFNQMADTISHQMETLEEKVAQRTEALEEMNQSLLEQKETIEYLSYHDQLTGLYNRRYFEETLMRLDNPHNLPLSLVMIDMNGLKLVNDAFGHAIGDKYLKKLARTIHDHLRTSDVAARYGGDEFIIILPKTNSEEAKHVLNRLYTSIEKPDIGIIPLSISYGIKTKRNSNESIVEILNNSDETMYTKKLVESQAFRSMAIHSILSHLKENFPKEHQHALDVQAYATEFAEYIGLSPEKIKILGKAAYMHDIGKISFSQDLINKPSCSLTTEEYDITARHTEIGYRILNAASETQAYSEIVLQHHENWDGKGYPKGLKGHEILIEARLLHIVEEYLTFHLENPDLKNRFDASIEHLLNQKGAELDPELVDAFIDFLKQSPLVLD